MAQGSSSSHHGHGPKVPILLLKTKSSPKDAYEELFSTAKDTFHFEPAFVPVLQHCMNQDGLKSVGALLKERRINHGKNGDYGGLIFTSQRAVEAFAELVQQGQGVSNDKNWPYLHDIPVYSVGPATTRALEAIPQSPPLRIFGHHTGNGHALAHYILEHYGEWYRGRPTKPPLLFMVGEQRRDIIPKTLMDGKLPADTRIEVTETVVYGTGVMESFPKDFETILSGTRDRPKRWVVVFSPSGCDSMLKGLGFVLDKETGKVVKGLLGQAQQRTTYIATIGPTTRDYLIHTFNFEPDVCAEEPSPEGIWQAITNFEYRES